jgi:GntR family transcriptional repressor for pyruvate dehydrogenase complex
MLQAMGVAEVRRGQGTIIREQPGEDILDPLIFQLILENADIRDLVDLRMMFEPAYSLMAMERATAEDLRAIEATVERFESVIITGTQTAEDDIAFHRAILRATHNPFVIRIGDTILNLFKASIRRSMREIPKTALHDHKLILDAFKAKNPDALQGAIVASFAGWRQSLNGGQSARPAEND